MERLEREVVLLEDVGEGPEAVPLGESPCFQHSRRCEGCGVRLVVQWIEGIGRRVPLGVINRSVTCVVTRVLRNLPHDAALGFEQLMFGVAVALVSVVGIIMCADKICGHVVAFTEAHELFDPFTLRCWRSSNFERRRDVLDRFSRVAIKLEVLALSSGPEHLEIRFIPDFKQPFANFPLAVSHDAVRHQTLNQFRPFFIVLRRRHVGLIAKHCPRAGSQRIRHEAQLDKRLHPDRKQEVEDLLDVEEGVEDPVLLTTYRSEVVR